MAQPLRPEIVQLFDQQRREQGAHVKTAEIRRNVRDAHTAALDTMDQLILRGIKMDEREKQADEIAESSKQFHAEAARSRKWCAAPQWWWLCK